MLPVTFSERPPKGGVRTAIPGAGTIYELSPPSNAGDPWHFTQLYAFLGKADGATPTAALWRTKTGDLYGTAQLDGLHIGSNFNNGTVFKLKVPTTPSGAWTLVLLHDFQGPDSGDGATPTSELIEVGGALYGTTAHGGTVGAGTVFSVPRP